MELGLQPVPDYLAAMRSGAGLGLSLKQQDFAEKEAADRLRQSYAHLAATTELGRRRMDLLSAANQIRQAHEDALLQHYQNMEENANKAAREPVLPQETTVGGIPIIYNPKSGHFIPKGNRLTGEALVEDEALKQQMNELSKTMAATINKKAHGDMMSRYNEMLDKRKRLIKPPDATTEYQPGQINPLPAQAAPPPSLQSSSDNEVIRVTKDGRKARFDATTKKFLGYAE